MSAKRPSASTEHTASTTRLFPPQHETADKGHGRIEIRGIWTSTELNDYIKFPYLKQVFRIERSVSDLQGKPMRHEIVYGVSSLTEQKASPADLLKFNRAHWEIENRLHWVRDVTFDEDRSQVRRGNGPQMMASLRNLAISLLRMSGATNIASATRHLKTPDRKDASIPGPDGVGERHIPERRRVPRWTPAAESIQNPSNTALLLGFVAAPGYR